jgi:hypothetical protein
MKKDEFLKYWKEIERDQELKPCSIPYKHEGSTFDCDGVRILGSKEFIESVLSRLKPLLSHENDYTRLGVSYTQATTKEGILLDSYKCYVQVHERGHQAQMCNLFVRGIKEKSFRNYNQKAETIYTNPKPPNQA